MTTEAAPAEQPPARIATTVMVVSDDPHVRVEAQFGFPKGVEVSIASDAREAWRLLPQVSPAVVVVDLKTGSAGGFGLCKDMAATQRFSNIPVLMLLEREQDAWLARQAGASLVRVKPIDVARLVDDTLSLTG